MSKVNVGLGKHSALVCSDHGYVWKESFALLSFSVCMYPMRPLTHEIYGGHFTSKLQGEWVTSTTWCYHSSIFLQNVMRTSLSKSDPGHSKIYNIINTLQPLLSPSEGLWDVSVSKSACHISLADKLILEPGTCEGRKELTHEKLLFDFHTLSMTSACLYMDVYMHTYIPHTQ